MRGELPTEHETVTLLVNGLEHRKRMAVFNPDIQKVAKRLMNNPEAEVRRYLQELKRKRPLFKEALGQFAEDLDLLGQPVVHRPRLTYEHVRYMTGHQHLLEAFGYLGEENLAGFALAFDYGFGVISATQILADRQRRSRRDYELASLQIPNMLTDLSFFDRPTHVVDQMSAQVADVYHQATELLDVDPTGFQALDMHQRVIQQSMRNAKNGLTPDGTMILGALLTGVDHGVRTYKATYPLTEGIVPDYPGTA